MPRAARRPAGSDVASRAGVSQKTVSRVMNGEPYVKEEVRLRVLQAAQELGYRRNNAARALNSGRTHRIGLVSLGSALHGPASMLFELERAARSTGYSLSVVTTFEGDPAGVAGAIDSLLTEGVDGIVLSEPIDEGENVRLDIDLPVVLWRLVTQIDLGGSGEIGDIFDDLVFQRDDLGDSIGGDLEATGLVRVQILDRVRTNPIAGDRQIIDQQHAEGRYGDRH